MMIQIEWWSRSSEDDLDLVMIIHVKWWSKSSDDDPTVMIQIDWWFRSRSSDGPDPMMMSLRWSRSSDDVPEMIQIEWWWSRLSDDLDLVMIIHVKWWSKSSDEDKFKMKMTWIWIGRDDLVNKEKKTSVDKLCRENIFLVKRECWCICNFGMYSPIYLMCCTPMFISESVCNVFESSHASMFLLIDSIM